MQSLNEDDFSTGVVDADGTVDIRKLAGALDLPVHILASAFQCKPEEITAETWSETLQNKGAMLLSIMEDLAIYMRSKSLAINFLKTPQPWLNGRSPIDELELGRLQRLCSAIDTEITLRPD